MQLLAPVDTGTMASASKLSWKTHRLLRNDGQYRTSGDILDRGDQLMARSASAPEPGAEVQALGWVLAGQSKVRTPLQTKIAP